ncbi:MAG: diaminopimelate decarboxylase [Leptolyngbya foveolarum]|uniref:Diaminopimelate decarboxylase n=1 Tax=Leptolyngbya foveolarum TaxID=47253 RepID=A0A2W4WCK0_9CYAN|nr:MAG: diaminopimelate decarboxylase [Leptolyngbya foveolarum]
MVSTAPVAPSSTNRSANRSENKADTAEIASSLQYLSLAAADDSPNQRLLPLTAEVNEKDHLVVGGCDVVDLIAEFGSPLYILDEQTLRTACRQYKEAFERHYPGESLIVYASKAWNCLAVCAIAAQEGVTIDVVSGGELRTAVDAGADPANLYFHGNNKSRDELKLGLDHNVHIVVDNWHEMQMLNALAGEAGKKATILLRLTPGIECHTHEYIQTGHIDSKFGFDPEQLEDVFKFISEQGKHLNCVGLHAHIGSQIFELQPHHDLAEVMVRWFQVANKYGLPIQQLDIGGGLGIRYTESDDPPSIDEWSKTVCESLAAACAKNDLPLPKILCEPGRSLVGSACVTAYTVGGQKTVPGIRKYVSVDGGMSDNPRPITYQSEYRVLAANKMSAPLSETMRLAGKHCESGDVIIQSASLPTLEAGEILVVPATGAYNYSMSSNYNRVPRPAAVLVNNGQADLILQRETYEDLVRHDRLPESLKPQQ